MSQVLRVLGRRFGEDFIFKGGTSLSKGYRIVERFSEDIDVLVVPGERGRGATDKLMKAMADAAPEGVGGSAEEAGGSEAGRHRSYEIAPPPFGSRPRSSTSVLVEMGVRGGPHPHGPVPISSLLGDRLEAAGTDLGEFDDLHPFEVAVLHRGGPCWKSSSSSTPWPGESPLIRLRRSTGAAAGISTTSSSSWAIGGCSHCSPTEIRPKR